MIVYDKQILNIEDYAIKHDFYGRDTLSFYIQEQHVQYKDITPLMVLHCRDDNQRYIVRKMDSGDVVADLDLTDLQAQMYVPYKSESGTAADIVSSVLPKGWELVDDTTLANRKTIELESATPLEIIEEVCNQFDIAVRYDNTKHIVKLVNPSISTTTTAYFTDELNLKSLATTVTTDEYATRLYAYGAEGLSFADINEGKPYVDAPSVSDGAPVVCTYWSDDRYTVKENLLQAAKEKIAELSTPQSSYELSVVDLAKIRPDEYGFLSVHLYDRVPLLDRKSNRRAVHQVIEYTEYPNYPTRNEIVLSTLPQSIQRTVSQVKDTVDNVTRPDGSLVADKIAGYINGAMASLRAQYNVADKQDVLAILFENLDETSEMYGALAIGTQGIMISKQRNADDSGWVWTTAITYAGIIANTIVIGQIMSQDGSMIIDLDGASLNMDLDDGSKIVIGKDGFYNQFGSSKNEYFHLMYSEDFEVFGTDMTDEGGYSKILKYTLPEEFSGKDVVIIPMVRQALASISWSISDFYVFDEYDKKTRTVTLIVGGNQWFESQATTERIGVIRGSFIVMA